MKLLSLDSWKLFFKWFIVFFAILGLQYLVLKKFVWHKGKGNHEALYIPRKLSNVVSFWYKKTENCHLIFQPYWADLHSQRYTDNQLNTILSRNLTYYKLRITYFQSPAYSFLEARDSIIVKLENGEIISHIPCAKSISNAPRANRLWLNTMCNPRNQEEKQKILLSLGIAAAVNQVKRKRAIMQKYLIAFAKPFAFDEIKEVRVHWNGKEYILSRKLCLRRDFDEYLRHPNLLFWNQPNSQILEK